MKNKNLLMILLFLFVTFTFISIVNAQKSKKNSTIKKNTATKKRTNNYSKSLTIPEKESVRAFIDHLNDLEIIYTSDPSRFSDKVHFFRDSGDSFIYYPEPFRTLAITAAHAYFGWGYLYGKATKTGVYISSEELEEAESRRKKDTTVSIISEFNLGGLSQFGAVASLRSIAINTKNQLEYALSITPTNTASNSSREVGIILVPIPKSKDINKADSEEKPKTETKTNPQILTRTPKEDTQHNDKKDLLPQKTEEFVGDWRGKLNSAPNIFFIKILKLDDGYYFAYYQNNLATQVSTVLFPIKIQDNNIILEAKLFDSGWINIVKFTFENTSSSSIKGTFTSSIKGNKVVDSIELERIR